MREERVQFDGGLRERGGRRGGGGGEGMRMREQKLKHCPPFFVQRAGSALCGRDGHHCNDLL